MLCFSGWVGAVGVGQREDQNDWGGGEAGSSKEKTRMTCCVPVGWGGGRDETRMTCCVPVGWGGGRDETRMTCCVSVGCGGGRDKTRMTCYAVCV